MVKSGVVQRVSWGLPTVLLRGSIRRSLQVLISASVTVSLQAVICVFLAVGQGYADNAEQG